MTTPAPETGRTAEEMRADIVAALNAAFRGFSFPGGRWSTGYGAEMAADALIAGPLAPILQEAASARKERDEALKLRKEDRAWYEMTVSVVEEQREDYRADSLRLHREKMDRLDRALVAEANLIALAKMYGEACGDLTYKWVCNNDSWNEAEARAEAAEAEAAHLRAENANLRDRVREAEGAGRDPDGSGHSRAEPASGLGPADECPSRAPWQPIATAPTDRPITLRMPAKCLPGGWFVATAQLPDPDDDSRFGSCSTIYHYNGAVLMGGFRGTWTHWREDAPPALGIDARSDETRSGSAEGESPSAPGGMPHPLSPEPQEAGDHETR